MNKIYDCFPFFQEIDLLDIRLHEMYDLVHRFVLVESPFTHQGNPKPLYFLENQGRFKQFADKIIHVVEDFSDTAPDPWARENAQRNRISETIENVEDGDLVIVSDLDEIPCAARLPFITGPMEKKPALKYLHMRFFYYFLNCEFREVVWDRGFIAPACLLKPQNLSHVRLSYSRLPKIMPIRGNLEIVERSVLDRKSVV
jgi:beta-1,4-mannosyl-glycoprotein beta-1,4-N-acetylglucosaminyltransferase